MIGEPDNVAGEGFRYLHPLSALFEFSRTVRSNLIPTIAAILSARNGGWIGTSIGSTILGIGLAVAIVRFFTFRYRIQNRELVIHQGLFGRTNRTVPVDRIQNIDLSQDLFHRMFRVGEVRIETASGKEPEAVMRVLSLSDYAILKEELNASRNTALRQPPDETAGINHVEPKPYPATEVALVSTSDSGPSPGPDKSSMTGEDSTSSEAHAARTILTLSNPLLLLAGFLSNRGEVIAGLIIGLIWQWRVGNDFIPTPWDTGVVSNRENTREMVKTISSDSTSIGTYFASLFGQYGPIATVLVLVACFIVFIFLLRIFSALWYVGKFYGYRLELKDDSLHVSCGLFTKISATIPRKHIQLVSVQQSWLAKRFGLASIRIETAGGDTKSEDAASSVGRRWFVPVVHYHEVPRILNELDSRITFDEYNLPWQPAAKGAFQRRIRPVLIFATILFLGGAFFFPAWGWTFGLVIALVGWFSVKAKSASRSYVRTDWGILYRSGVRVKRCSMTTWEKIQSVKITESPFDRKWRMASLHIDTAFAGPAAHTLDVEMMDADFVAKEFRQINSQLEPRTTEECQLGQTTTSPPEPMLASEKNDQESKCPSLQPS